MDSAESELTEIETQADEQASLFINFHNKSSARSRKNSIKN